MKARVEGRWISVTLSYKNLLDLVAQEMHRKPGGAVLHRAQEDGTNLSISVQSNDLHYEDRVPGPGSGLV